MLYWAKTFYRTKINHMRIYILFSDETDHLYTRIHHSVNTRLGTQ